MGIEFTDGKKTLQGREFNLLGCKVLRKTISFFNDATEREETAKVILFQPNLESTESAMLLSAWYDDARPHHETGKSNVQLPVFIGSVGMLARVRMQWPNKLCETPHFFLESVSVEELINGRESLEKVDLKVFPVDKLDELGLLEGRFRG